MSVSLLCLAVRALLWTECCLLLLLGVCVWRLVEHVRRMGQLPPGPWGVPLLGFLPYLRGAPHDQFSALSAKYGKLFSVQLGSQLMVVLADHKLIRKAFRKEAFSARPDNEISAIINGYGVINADGKLWKEQRKFLHEQLRKFGMKQLGHGKEVLEARIKPELGHFLEQVAAAEGDATNLNSALTLAFSNVICSLLMSIRFEEKDLKFCRFTELIEEGFQLCTATGASNFVPCLRHLPRLQVLNEKIMANREEMSQFFRGIVEAHKESFNPEEIRDVVDTYLLEIDVAQQEGRLLELFGGKDPDMQIYQILGDMYSAGMETTKTTMSWAVLYMLHYPHVLQNVQNELLQVVGTDRLPSLQDLPSLPYTEATLLEVFRRACVIPMGTTHCTTMEVNLEGYVIPKNAQVVPLLYAVHMDPELWPEPHKFDPSRFLGEGRVVKPDWFIPFGTGRRACLGELLARHQLFLFFASLVHVFDLKPEPGSSLPDLVGKSAVSITPKDYQVCAKRRSGDFGLGKLNSVPKGLRFTI